MVMLMSARWLFCSGWPLIAAWPKRWMLMRVSSAKMLQMRMMPVRRAFRWRVLVVMFGFVCGLVYIHIERSGVCKWGLSLMRDVCCPHPGYP